MRVNARRASLVLATTLIALAACDGCSEKPEVADAAAPEPIEKPDTGPPVDPLKEAKEKAETESEAIGVHVSDMAALVGAAIEAARAEKTVAKSGTKPRTKAPEHNGVIDAKAAGKAFRKYDGAMRKCYERSLKRKPGLDGKVKLVVVVGDDGAVRSASARDVSLGDNAVGVCMKNLAKRIKFPKPTGGTASLAKTYAFTPQL